MSKNSKCDAENCLRDLLPANAEEIIQNIACIKSQGFVPAAFFDYDGTIIDGDVTEGTVPLGNTQNPPPTNPGLDEILIGLGYSSCFPSGSFREFRHQYDTMYETNRAQGLALALTIFNGVSVRSIEKVVKETYKSAYAKYFWKTMAELLFCLANLGVVNIIITASPTIFVTQVQKYLPINEVLGVDVAIIKDKLTNKITKLPYNLEKRRTIIDFLEKNPKIVPVLGAGNTVNGDYPFLSYLLGLGAPGYFVLDPASTGEANRVIGLGLTPIFVTEHFSGFDYLIRPSKAQPYDNNNSCGCRGNNTCGSCYPIIPLEIYTKGEISAR